MPKRQLGVALRKLREARGLDRRAAAGVLECSLPKISRIESGEVGVKASELRSLLDLYGVEGQERADLERLGQQTRQRGPQRPGMIPDWFRKYVNLEEAAIAVRTYREALVPGPLQTAEYARHVFLASPLPEPEDIPRLVETRMARMARLTGERPLQVHAVLSEAVLLAQVGGPDVMREQIEHLRTLAGLDHIVIQVMPLSAGAHAASGFPFSLLRLPNSAAQDIVYLEDLTGARYIESDPEEQSRYEIVWHYLARTALPAAETIARLDNLVPR